MAKDHAKHTILPTQQIRIGPDYTTKSQTGNDVEILENARYAMVQESQPSIIFIDEVENNIRTSFRNKTRKINNRLPPLCIHISQKDCIPSGQNGSSALYLDPPESMSSYYFLDITS